MQFFYKVEVNSTTLEIELVLEKETSHPNVMISQLLCFGIWDNLEALGVLMGSFESFSPNYHCAFVNVSLMQLLSYMLWKKGKIKIKN